MDNRTIPAVHELFSRGSTPPHGGYPIQGPAPPMQNPNTSANPIDNLFQNLTSPDQLHRQPGQQPLEVYNNPSPPNVAADDPNIVINSPNVTTAERQNALLSLLGGPTATVRNSQPQTQGPLPQQVPTPPGGPSQRSNEVNNETQGKILLEQLMAGNPPPRSNYSDSQSGSIAGGVAPSPPYGPLPAQAQQSRAYLHDPAIEVAQPSHQLLQQSQQPSAGQQHTQRPGSPRRSMFDFVSPFDALSSPGSIKKKPVPQTSSLSSGNEDSGSWTAVTDPKRQSVDNLLEHLTRQAPPSYDAYLGGTEFEQIRSPPQQQQPIGPKPTTVPVRTASPRSSPPKTQAAVRAPARFVESPSSQQGNGRKESSPGPRGGSIRGKGGAGKNNKNQSNLVPSSQTIVFDVATPLNEIQATPESVKSTAIALVRQDSVFLPGTTIGATHWVAYAMTRGRVRVISRSSGDRTLLQLPTLFPGTSSVSDMAVNGNRLAGVTSDGGFVVWELPEVIHDDVPGTVLLCIPPSHDSEALQSVKWHPKDPDTLAVASENDVFLIDLGNTHTLRGQTLAHSDLHHIGQIFAVSSPIVAFDFDTLNAALATISVDSTLTIWNVRDKVPYTTHKIRGEDIPSSLTFVDGGIVVGRKRGTVLQLISNTSKAVLSTVKFVNGQQDDNDMFGHVAYDSRIQTLWVANCKRESMIAFRLNLDPSISGDDTPKSYFDQVIEFVGPKPTIHFVILTADADPTGDEAYAACVAAKLNPGELALVAFSVHSTGVDQILIRKEWFDAALNSTIAKFPPYVATPTSTAVENKGGRMNQGSASTSGPSTIPARLRTPPSEDVENDNIKLEEGRIPETKSKPGRGGKNVNFKDVKDDNGNKDNKNNKAADTALINESGLGQALSREIRKTEENLHTRIGRLMSKEMDKQHQRFEDARAHEQAEDFARQEKILKLISTELSKNTTRVVESAVKTEVQNTVLPALENITKTEVKAALNEQISRVLVDLMSQSLPAELEKLLVRPDIAPHLSRILSSGLTPVIERYIKDAFKSTIVQQTSALHQELLMEIRNDMHKLKTDLANWQSDTIRSQESSIRDLDRTVRSLADQVKFLTMNNPNVTPHGNLHQLQQQQQQAPHNSSGSGVPHQQPNLQLRPQQAMQAPLQQQSLPPTQHYNYQQPPPIASSLPPNWFGSNIAAPQASHPATLPQAPGQASERTPPLSADQWDELYLSVLSSQDPSKLRDLLSRTSADLIMPINGTPLVSQAVILTLVHRLSAVVGESAPGDEVFKTSLWWLQRSVAFLRPEDKLISDFIPRVIPNVQVLLNNTKQRLAILPGGPQTLETARTISEIQDALRRKVAV